MPSITDTAISLGSAGALIQNLGPDALYLGSHAVTTDDGIKVSVGEALTIGYTDSAVFGVSDGTSDVRVLRGGMGISPAPPA